MVALSLCPIYIYDTSRLRTVERPDVDRGLHNEWNARMILNPTQKDVGELLSGRLFRIPDYQRAYSWRTSQRGDLFADILETHAKKRKHFMATVVARQSSTKTIAGDDFSVVDIIDGQQRITTIVILFKAIAKALKNTSDVKEDTSDVNAAIANKLNDLLMKGDDYQEILLQTNHGASGIFKSYIKTGVVAADQVKTSADQNLVDAMQECEAFIINDTASLTPAEIYETVRNHFVMIYHQIDDEAVVYRVFETLNSRGLEVKWLDKTKSQLMALLFEHAGSAYSQAIEEMRNIWAGVYATLGLDVSRGDEAMRFAGTLKAQNQPYKVLGDEIASRSLVSFAKTDVDSIVGAARWLAKVIECHKKIVSDPRLLGVTGINQARFLATAILLRGWPDDIEQLLIRKWEKITFRIYGLYQCHAKTKVKDYVGLGYDIINDEKMTPDSVLHRLDKIGDGHKINKIIFKKKYWNDCYNGWTTELRYILSRYDEHLAESVGEILDTTAWSKIWQVDASKSIEHISPKSEGKSWVHEIGNLTMLTPGMNASLKNKHPVDKAEKYLTVGIRGTALIGKTIEDKGRWGRREVTARTKKIAEFVNEHWGD